ncbi:MAG: tRNA lysidine(34) synthetase TilS [Burkholderiales bacterium]
MPPGRRPASSTPRDIAVAFSGGRDSTALLHACARALQGSGHVVHALHVHHGLSLHADGWLAHGRAQCARWAQRGLPVRFHAEHVEVVRGAGVSIEAAARQQRYAALARMARAQGCAMVLLAHHQQDQAETVLLQALRGAGPKGLSAMPRASERDGLLWVRPWLDHPRAAIEAYVKRHRLSFVDDDSNADPRHARNRLRLSVWPALVAAFPDAATALGDVARQAQDACEGLDTQAQADLSQVAAGAQLSLEPWLALPRGRARHVLRLWLAAQADGTVTRALLVRLSAELCDARGTGRWLLPHGELRLFRGVVRWLPPSLTVASDSGREPSVPVILAIAAPGAYPVPAWHGVLQVRAVRHGGVAPALLGRIELRERQGGEQFQREPATPPRALKKQYQQAAVPAWQRGGPLLYQGDNLVYVPGLGIDARQRAPLGAAQWTLHWRSDSDLAGA